MSNITSVSTGGNHTCAIDALSDLYCWGHNRYGQLGDGTTTDSLIPLEIMSNITSVSTGGNHTCAIDTNLDLYCWGDNTFGQIGNVDPNYVDFVYLPNIIDPNSFVLK